MNSNQTFAICKHTRGGWAVWELQRLLTVNRQKATRGSLAESWNPVDLAPTHEAALKRMSELKASCHPDQLPFEEPAES